MATSIPLITETIDPYSVTPVLNSPAFPEDIDTYNGEQPSRIDSKNTVNTQINAVVVAMNTFGGEMETIEQNASDSETAAGNSADDALAAQEAAETAQTAAELAQTGAEAALDSFDDKYLGAKASDPTLDNDGDPLTTGATYYNTTVDQMKVYDVELVAWAAITFVPTSHVSLSGKADSNVHPASSITNTPTGNISATTIQAAIDELDTEKMANLSDDTSPQLTGNLDTNDKTFNGSSYRQITDASLGSGTHTFNYANGDRQKVTLTGDTVTFAFSNFPTGVAVTFMIDAENWGAWIPAYPANLNGTGKVFPEFTASGIDRVMIEKDENEVYSLFIVGLDVGVMV